MIEEFFVHGSYISIFSGTGYPTVKIESSDSEMNGAYGIVFIQDFQVARIIDQKITPKIFQSFTRNILISHVRKQNA